MNLQNKNNQRRATTEDMRAPLQEPGIPALPAMGDPDNLQYIRNYFETVTVIPVSAQKPKTLWDSIKIYVDSISAPTIKRLYIYDTKRKVWDYTTIGTGAVTPDMQIFTSSGTYNVPAGARYVRVRMVGSGQGGSYIGSSGSTAAPGAAGDYCEKIIDLLGVSTVTVTIGAASAGGTSGTPSPAAGGDVTFGAYLLAKGGGSGSTTTGTIIIAGYGSRSVDMTLSNTGSSTNFTKVSASGCDSVLGKGGTPAIAVAGSQADGNAGEGYGSGGSGGASGNAGGTANGGAGKKGVCIVEVVG